MAAPATHRVEAPVLVAMREIAKAVAAARDAMAFETDPNVLGESMCELVGLGSEIDSLRIGLVALCESNGVPQSAEVRTVGQYVAGRTNASPRSTNQDSRLARWLRTFSRFAEALERRDMTIEHLLYLRNQLDGPRTTALLLGDQQFFVDLARDTGFRQFKTACDYWLIMIDPDGKEPVDQLDTVGAKVEVGSGGRTRITMDNDAVAGHALTRMIEHEAGRIRKQDLADGVERTVAQRRHAAMFALMERGFRRETGSHPIPLVNLVMSERVAEWAVAKLQSLGDGPCTGVVDGMTCQTADADTVPVHPLEVDGRCEFIDGRPVHPLLVAAALGLQRYDIATMRRYVMTAEDRIVNYSYNTRIAPEHVRTAGHIEHRGQCAVHGCDAPHSWLQVDHIDPHSNGGPTNLRNTEPKCEADNKAKGAQTGHVPWKDRPPPPRHRPRRTSEDDDPHDQPHS